MRLMPIVVLAACVAASACAKGQQNDQPAADSTAAPAMSGVADSAARDTARAESAATATKSGAKVSAPTTQKTPGIIGRDSAFGPIGTVDSTGKVTPIVPTKKKP